MKNKNFSVSSAVVVIRALKARVEVLNWKIIFCVVCITFTIISTCLQVVRVSTREKVLDVRLADSDQPAHAYSLISFRLALL